MNHLETLLAEYLEWQGFFVRRNTKVGRLAHGGWEMELDVVGYNPQTNEVVHYEPSIDAHSWATREERFRKKFDAGMKYIRSALFPWLDDDTEIHQVAVIVSHPKGRDDLAGGEIVSVDEMMAEIKRAVFACGPMVKNAIAEQYPLLRTLQMAEAGYHKSI